MIFAITGGRDYKPSRKELSFFLALVRTTCTEVHHGASGSVDWGVSTLVRFKYPKIKVVAHPVDTSIDGPWPAAGCVRNTRMLRNSKCNALVSFKGGRGTADCTRKAHRMEIMVFAWNGFAWSVV